MRKTMVVVAAIVIGLSAKAQKEKRETIEGNGNLVTKEITVSPFSVLEASGVYELILVQGNKEGVKIEADENMISYFNVHNDGQKLVLDMKDLKTKNFNLKKKMKVYVTFKTLKEMDLNMVGNVHATEALNFDDVVIKNSSVGKVDLAFSASKFNLQNSSVGRVKLSGKAENAIVVNNGVGRIEAGTFVVQSMNIVNAGVGHAEVNAEKELKVKDNLLGRVNNKGAASIKKTNRVEI